MQKFRNISGRFIQNCMKIVRFHKISIPENIFVIIEQNVLKFCKSVYFRRSYSEVFLRKGVLKICSRFTGEHPYRSAISIKLLFKDLWWCFFGKKWTAKSYFSKIFSNKCLTGSWIRLCLTLHCTKKRSFPLKISSVNATKSAGNCGFDHIYWRNP